MSAARRAAPLGLCTVGASPWILTPSITAFAGALIVPALLNPTMTRGGPSGKKKVGSRWGGSATTIGCTYKLRGYNMKIEFILEPFSPSCVSIGYTCYMDHPPMMGDIVMLKGKHYVVIRRNFVLDKDEPECRIDMRQR